MYVKDITHPDDMNNTVQVVSASISNPKLITTFNKRFKHKTGAYIWGKITAFGFRLNERKHLCGMALLEDINEDVKMKAALELERSKSITSAKLAALGEMSAEIAHEIKNPLTIIAAGAPLLLNYINEPEKLRQNINVIEKSCERISKIVNGLLKFSRSSGKVEYGRYSLGEIANEVLTLTLAKSKKHSTPVTIDIQTDVFILCCEVEIEQVLVNLINNAIDAVQPKPEKWVKLFIGEDARSAILRITDSGEGIAQDIKNKLFEPFFTTKKIGEGTGLGLSIAKGIVEEHKGTISINNESSNTCFEIRFPKIEGV